MWPHGYIAYQNKGENCNRTGSNLVQLLLTETLEDPGRIVPQLCKTEIYTVHVYTMKLKKVLELVERSKALAVAYAKKTTVCPLGMVQGVGVNSTGCYSPVFPCSH
jgi:hypothetical protein